MYNIDKTEDNHELKGVVVDFYRMRKVHAIDAKNLTVTVASGITWEAVCAR